MANHFWYKQFNFFDAYQNFGPASLQFVCFWGQIVFLIYQKFAKNSDLMKKFTVKKETKQVLKSFYDNVNLKHVDFIL